MQPVQSQGVYNTLASNSIADIVIVVVNPTEVESDANVLPFFKPPKNLAIF